MCVVCVFEETHHFILYRGAPICVCHLIPPQSVLNREVQICIRRLIPSQSVLNREVHICIRRLIPSQSVLNREVPICIQHLIPPQSVLYGEDGPACSSQYIGEDLVLAVDILTLDYKRAKPTNVFPWQQHGCLAYFTSQDKQVNSCFQCDVYTVYQVQLKCPSELSALELPIYGSL